MVDEGVDSDDSDNSEATLKTKDFDEKQDALDRKEPPRSAINSDGKYTVRGRGVETFQHPVCNDNCSNPLEISFLFQGDLRS